MVVTAKDLRAAAASVRGARSMGLVTEASERAPALLEQARKVLARLEDKAAEDALCELGGRAVAKYNNFAAALRELEDALGVERPAAPTPTPPPEPEPEPEIDPAIRAVAERVGEDPTNPRLRVRSTKYVDRRGVPVVQVGIAGYNEGHTSSLDGSYSNGRATWRGLGFICADGTEPETVPCKGMGDLILWREDEAAVHVSMTQESIVEYKLNRFDQMEWRPRHLVGPAPKEGDTVLVMSGYAIPPIGMVVSVDGENAVVKTEFGQTTRHITDLVPVPDVEVAS